MSSVYTKPNIPWDIWFLLETPTFTLSLGFSWRPQDFHWWPQAFHLRSQAAHRRPPSQTPTGSQMKSLGSPLKRLGSQMKSFWYRLPCGSPIRRSRGNRWKGVSGCTPMMNFFFYQTRIINTFKHKDQPPPNKNLSPEPSVPTKNYSLINCTLKLNTASYMNFILVFSSVL